MPGPEFRIRASAMKNSALLVAIGSVGGSLALWIGLPMPFLLGSLFTVGAYSIFRGREAPIMFPAPARRASIAVIGAMIGSAFSPEFAAVLPSLWISLAGAAAYVVAAQCVSYQIFRKIGSYGPATALFAAMPGGFIEAISLGERAGADLELVTLQHFARIILVVAFIPLLFYFWSGQTVGSAGGQAISDLPHGLSDILWIALIAAAGTAAGKAVRFPASHMAGPLILSAAAHAFGLADVRSPEWLLWLAQLLVGTSLGAQFSGTSPRMLISSFGLGTLSVAAMLTLSAAFALIVGLLAPFPVEALMLSYSPGGVTEMGLIALSLNMSPIFVAAHHLFRILFTVMVARIAATLANIDLEE